MSLNRLAHALHERHMRVMRETEIAVNEAMA
jgi:hypothetical protein